MKKLIAAALAMLMAALLCSCGKTAGAKINLGSSEIYSDAEIKAAAAAVKAKFATFDGCTLHSLPTPATKNPPAALIMCGTPMKITASALFLNPRSVHLKTAAAHGRKTPSTCGTGTSRKVPSVYGKSWTTVTADA